MPGSRLSSPLLTLVCAVLAFTCAPVAPGPASSASSAEAATAPVPAPAAAAAAARVPASLAAYVAADRADAQWSLAATRVPAAWTASTGAGVVVAVVDSGVDATTPDLAGRIVSPAHLDPVTDTIVAGGEQDRVGHGTHVAGIVAARADGSGITGVAPDARVMPVNIATSSEVGGVEVARAVRWAVAHGARVVNLSIGQSDIEITARDVAPVCAAVADAVAAGVVVVAAAGNDGTGLNLREAPATCPGALAVAAVSPTLQPAVWSSFDADVSVAAPGDDVYSTVPRFVARTGYATMSGTSMATPFVSGVAALLLSVHPDWTPAQVRARLEATAADVPPAGPDPRTGAGVVAPAAALGVDAPPPAPVPHLTVGATPYPSRLGSDGLPVFDSTYVNWIPDAGLPVTGYRLTRWTETGPQSVVLPAASVRAVDPVALGGWTVTALTADGEVVSAPVWSAAGDTGRPPARQMLPPVRLRAAWTLRGDLVVTWTNPTRNGTRADRWALLVGDQPLRGNERPGRVPARVVVPAAELPAGDLRVTVAVGSTRDETDADASVLRPARVPFSGRAVQAGLGRYRLYLALAPSWARRACGSSRCPGTELVVTVAGLRYRTWLDGTGTATATVRGPAGARRLALRVAAADQRRHLLDMPAAASPLLVVPVGRR